ncbi:MAG: hypothetical protein AAF456_05650 [Planctomycetota bacterium]
MRTVSFSNPQVQNALNNDFVATYTNTTGDPTAGRSFSHPPEDSPGSCGFGAGKQNVQAIFMTPEGEIFHVASGFRNGERLLDEINFAKGVYASLEDASNPERTVSELQVARLEDLGFDSSSIERGRVGMMSMMPTGSNVDFAPQDLGIQMPSTGTGMFEDMIRQRVLNDGTFVARNPLMTRSEFDASPEKLLGNGTSFFGSHSSMNNLSGNDFNRQRPRPDMNRMMQQMQDFGNSANMMRMGGQR